MTAETPVLIVWLQGLAVPTLAAFGAYIAWHQYSVSSEKLRLDLFDKRMKAYDLTVEFMKQVFQDQNVWCRFEKIWEARGMATFLFGEDIDEELAKAQEAAREIYALRRKLENGNYNERNFDQEKIVRYEEDFQKHFVTMPKVFARYMQFTQAKKNYHLDQWAKT